MEECAHTPCTCEVTGNAGFCSTQCEQSTRTAPNDAGCECPHDDCAGHEEID